MDRLFDINLLDDAGWTDGEQWDDCNPVQNLNGVYHRIYSGSSYEDPNYRIDPGDGFFIGAASHTVRDWTPKTAPWTFDISGAETAPMTFKFGLQRGDSGIDTNLELHSPWITGFTGVFIQLAADYHRFEGLKVKDADPLFTLIQDCTGIQVHNAVFNNAALIDTGGYRMIGWILRKLTFLNTVFKALNIPLGSNTVSMQDFTISGEGDIGVSAEAGHYGIEIIGGEIINDNHLFTDTGVPYNGLYLADGDEAIVRDVSVSGFSGTAHHFDCPVEVKYLRSSHDNAGIYFGKASTAHSCFVQWLRQIQGQSFAYWVKESLEITNSGCNLDETGGLGVFVGEEGSTVTINGGDYQFRIPLPFITAMGNCTVVLNNVVINGELYNESFSLVRGESWRGVKAALDIETIPVYNNAIHFQPYDHIPMLKNAVSLQGNNEPFNSLVTLPSGAKVGATPLGSLRYDPRDVFLHLDPGETADDYLRYSTEDNIYIHKFTIEASPEVGAKVVQPDAFSGSGWSRVDETYTAEDTDNAISASYNFEAGEVYQISVCIDELTTGRIKPAIGNVEADYFHSALGHEVWLIRAPSSATTVSVKGDAFSGTISCIYVRKLLRTETPAVPELEASVDGNNVTLEWFIKPVELVTDTKTPRVTKTGELAESAKNGYYDNDKGVYLFEDCYSHGRKTAINLRGGDALEVYKLWVTGGYLGEDEKWQNAISPEMNKGPYFEIIQACYVKCDLYLESSVGAYNSQFGNCDVIVLNGANNTETLAARAFVLGLHGQGSTDSVIDSKKRVEINHSTLVGAYRTTRLQRNTTSLISNCDFIREWGTREAVAPTHPFTLAHMWNCYVDGVRCVNTDDMHTQTRSDSAFPTSGVININHQSVAVLKTYPTINDHCRVAMTDMEFEVSTDSGSTWSTLDVPDVGLPGVVGAFLRTINFSSGTYSMRCRCLNGGLVGAWSNTVSFTI
tara:strand:- start:4035 stop:6920 length:2886 start_codon:yes stop_codon:yes gene_type:complete